MMLEKTTGQEVEKPIINKNASYEGNMFAVVYGYQKDVLKMILKDRAFRVFEMLLPEDVESRRIAHLAAQGNCRCQIVDEKDDVSTAYCKYVLLLASERGEEGHKQIDKRKPYLSDPKFFKPVELDEKTFFTFMAQKKLIYTTRWLQYSGDMESKINKAFCNNVLLIRKNFDNKLYDDVCDIRLFFQKTATNSNDEQKRILPVDIRNFKINKKILKYLRKISKNEFRVKGSDIMMSYSMESEKIQAQYFVTRYHNNLAWDKNMVCILGYRFSAFLLPEIIADTPNGVVNENTYTKDKNGAIYKIDSIQYTTDICFDLEQLKKLLIGLHTEIYYA